MSAPAGNQFWKLRATHGRNLIFSSPTILKEACDEYFEVTSQRVWIKEDWVGKDADRVERKTSVPFTLTGLYIFLDINRSTWDEYRQKDGFSAVCTHVEQVIYNQKFEGATVGAYNANIIARDLGLVDKKEESHKIQSPVIVDWSGDSITLAPKPE